MKTRFKDTGDWVNNNALKDLLPSFDAYFICITMRYC